MEGRVAGGVAGVEEGWEGGGGGEGGEEVFDYICEGGVSYVPSSLQPFTSIHPRPSPSPPGVRTLNDGDWRARPREKTNHYAHSQPPYATPHFPTPHPQPQLEFHPQHTPRACTTPRAPRGNRRARPRARSRSGRQCHLRRGWAPLRMYVGGFPFSGEQK